MTTEQLVLIELLKSDITGKEPKIPDGNINWTRVAKESFSQTVAVSAIVAATKIKERIPADIYNSWFEKACIFSAKNAIVDNWQKELVQILSSNNYDYVILKGETSASYYKNPQNRILGDVDFLVSTTQKESVKQLLKSNGYVSYKENHDHHIVFNKNGAHLEMHHKPAGIPCGKAGAIIDNVLSNTLSNTQNKNIGSGDFTAPNDLYHGLILLLHTQHHLLYEGIGLRHLCDVVAFVNSTKDKSFYSKEFLPLLKQIGLHTFFSVLVDIAIIYFGVEQPSWHTITDKMVAQEVLEDIISGGNFGKKDSLRGRSGNLIANHKTDGKKHSKLYNLFRTLKDSTDEVFPIVKKHPFLYAVYLPYRALKYVILVIKGKRINILKTVPLADKRQKLYDKLHVFDVK